MKQRVGCNDWVAATAIRIQRRYMSENRNRGRLRRMPSAR